MSRPLPLVLLIDLDGTTVGPIDHMIMEYDLHKRASDHKTLKPAIRRQMVERLQQGVLRPHFGEFARGCPCEMFVYTAGTPEWASFIVPCIEMASSIERTPFRFNRPIFARDQCFLAGDGQYRKSIEKVRPKIYRALRSRYPALTSPRLLKDRVLLIDNTPGVLVESSYMLLCPTYSFEYAYDFASQLSPAQLQQHFRLIGSMLSLRPDATTDFYSLMAAYYTILGQSARQSASPANLQKLGDRFWARLDGLLRKAIGKQHVFSPPLVRALNARASPM